MLTMKKFLHNKEWNAGKVQVNIDQPQVTLIKSTKDDKPDKYFVKMIFCRDLKSEKLDLYEFKMVLFDNGEPEEFLLFIWNFNMNLEASGTFKSGKKIQ